MNLFPLSVPCIVLPLADIFLGEHERAKTFLGEEIDVAFCVFKEGILLSVSFLQKFLDDGVGTLAEKLDVPSLLVLYNHRHSLSCAIELKYV